jgi:hypothetical protein
MHQPSSTLRDLFKNVATAAVVWTIVGVPVATVVAASRVFVWVITSLPEMAATAAVLGGVHGLWLYLVGQRSDSAQADLRWFGPVSGGILGLLGYPPVFSRINGIVVDRLAVAVFLLAAVCGGTAAGFAAARRVVPLQLRGRRSIAGRRLIIGCFFVLPVAAVDYHFYWPSTVDRLPVPRVSHRAVTNIPAGDARGSTWTGCYQYLGELSRGSGVLGKEGGLLRVAQSDGFLKVSDGSAGALLGGVNADGRFRFGVERTAPDRDVLRVLWEGKFEGRTLGFTKRTTGLRGENFLNTTRLTGTAHELPCDR